MSWPSAIATPGAHTTRLSPATGAMAGSTPTISSSLSPTASAHPVAHSGQTGRDPSAAAGATRSSAVALGPGKPSWVPM